MVKIVQNKWYKNRAGVIVKATHVSNDPAAKYPVSITPTSGDLYITSPYGHYYITPGKNDKDIVEVLKSEDYPYLYL